MCLLKLLNTGVSFPSDGAWQHLGILSTLRSISSGVHEIHIRQINKLSRTLRLQLFVLFDIRQSSGSYKYCPPPTVWKINTCTLFQKLISEGRHTFNSRKANLQHVEQHTVWITEYGRTFVRRKHVPLRRREILPLWWSAVAYPPHRLSCTGSFTLRFCWQFNNLCRATLKHAET